MNGLQLLIDAGKAPLPIAYLALLVKLCLISSFMMFTVIAVSDLPL